MSRREGCTGGDMGREGEVPRRGKLFSGRALGPGRGGRGWLRGRLNGREWICGVRGVNWVRVWDRWGIESPECIVAHPAFLVGNILLIRLIFLFAIFVVELILSVSYLPQPQQSKPAPSQWHPATPPPLPPLSTSPS